MEGKGVRRCACRREAIIREKLKVILKDWPKYAQSSLDQNPRSVAQENAFVALRENPRGSYFITGYYSRGKTHLLVAQYRQLIMQGARCELRSARDLMEELRKAETPAQNDKEVFESPVLQLVNLSEAGHLFIDDIEKAPNQTNFRAEMIFDLLDTIQRRQLAITVTSNLPMIIKDEVKKKDTKKRDLRDVLGDAAVSRLYHLCKVLEL